MKVIVDADACPVTKIVIKICNENNIDCLLVTDMSHQFDYNNVIYVDGGSDAADYKIVEVTNSNDLVVTQDYGLATMVLSKNAQAINQNGMIYNANNIMGLLETRAFSAKLRKHKTHLKGPRKRTNEDNEKFIRVFSELLDRMIKEN